MQCVQNICSSPHSSDSDFTIYTCPRDISRKMRALLDLPEFDPPIAGADSAFTCTHMYLEILRCNLEILQSEHRKVKKF